MSTPGDNTTKYMTLLYRFTSSGQWDRALDTAREWLAADPESSRAHIVAGQALVSLDRHAEAEPHVQCALARDPDNDFAHRLMSIIHFRLQRFKAADEA